MEGKSKSGSRLPIVGKNVSSGKPSPARDESKTTGSAPPTLTSAISRESTPLTLSGKTPVQLVRMESVRGRSDSWEWDGTSAVRASLSPRTNVALQKKAESSFSGADRSSGGSTPSTAPNSPKASSPVIASAINPEPSTPQAPAGPTTPKSSARDRERIRRAALDRLSVTPGELAALGLQAQSNASSASSSSKGSPTSKEKQAAAAAPVETVNSAEPKAVPPLPTTLASNPSPSGSGVRDAGGSGSAKKTGSAISATTAALLSPQGRSGSPLRSQVVVPRPVDSSTAVNNTGSPPSSGTSSNVTPVSSSVAVHKRGSSIVKKSELPLSQQSSPSQQVNTPTAPNTLSGSQKSSNSVTPRSASALSPKPAVPNANANSTNSNNNTNPSLTTTTGPPPQAAVSSPSLANTSGASVGRTTSGSVVPHVSDTEERARLWKRELELKEKELEEKERRLQEKERQIERTIEKELTRRSPRPDKSPRGAESVIMVREHHVPAKPATKSPRSGFGSMVVARTDSQRMNQTAAVTKQALSSPIASPSASTIEKNEKAANTAPTTPSAAQDAESNDFYESRSRIKKEKKEKKEKGSNLKKISLSLRKLGELGYPSAPISPTKSPKSSPKEIEASVSPKNPLSASSGSRSARAAMGLHVPKTKDRADVGPTSPTPVGASTSSGNVPGKISTVASAPLPGGPVSPNPNHSNTNTSGYASQTPNTPQQTLSNSVSHVNSNRRMPEKSRSASSLRGQTISPIQAPRDHHHHHAHKEKEKDREQPRGGDKSSQIQFDKDRLLMTGGAREDSRDELNKLSRDTSENSLVQHTVHPPGQRFGTVSAATGAAVSNASSPALMEPVLIESATVDQLISALADENLPDWKFVREFLVVYRYFLPPDDLLSRLINRFMFPKGEEGPIRLRVINILKRWLNQHFYDFENQNVLNTLINFIDSTVDPWNNKWANALRFALQEKNSTSIQLSANCSLDVIAMALKKSSIVRDHILKKSDFPKSFIGSEAVVWLKENLKLSSSKEAIAVGNNLLKEKFIINCVSENIPFSDDEQSYFRFLRQPTDPIELPTPKPLFKKKYLDRDPHTLSFADFQPQEIARQLTLVEHKYYRRIQPTEIKSQGWNKPNRHQVSPNVCALTERFNKMSYWVATEIVLAPANEAHKVIERMIQIAIHLCELRNFNTLIATVAGLNLSAVARLKDAWSRVGKTCMTSFQELTELCNPIANYKQYREAFKSVHPPAVPYIALYLHDLTFIEDGNQDYVDGDGRTVINFAKMRMIANVFLAIEKFQRVDFNLQQVQVILDVLGNARCVTDEDDLYKLSTLQSPSSRDSATPVSSKEAAAIRAQILKTHAASTLHSSISVPQSLADLAKEN